MQRLKIFYGTDPQAEKYGGNGYAWPESEQKRKEFYDVKRNRPHEAQSVYMCNPGQREGSIFMESDFAFYRQPFGGFLEQGIADPAVREFISRGHEVVVAWDTAQEALTTSAYTVGVVGLLVPCSSYHCGEDIAIYGPCDPHFDVYIVDIFRDKIDFGDLVKAFRTIHVKWSPSLHVVERRASGHHIIQSLEKIMTIEGVDAQESKRKRALMGVGASSAQGWFRQHRVYFPSEEPDRGGEQRRPISWLHTFKTELKDFVGDESATSDQADALIHLLHYAIRQSSNMSMMPTGWSPETVDQEMGLDLPFDPKTGPSSPLQLLQWADSSFDDPMVPFADTCGNCAYYNMNARRPQFSSATCIKHQRQFVALDSCDDFTRKA